MNILWTYMDKMCKQLLDKSMRARWQELDYRLQDIERYIRYLVLKQASIRKLIDSLSLTLENKYIDIIESAKNISACKIESADIEAITSQLNHYEATYAELESTITAQHQEKLSTEAECDMLQQLRLGQFAV